jgi:TolB-like protein/Tfp pilus assembly protein PilF
MSSIIEGYNYDIFISYRQKDNKGDRWVSEFVEALKTELESTFKEEISVYFDINPHDGLLETHDVNASLKEKLKCLVFIPILSRTYCDPKSFAWEHEFKVFVKLASQDQFGLRVKLPNGNVASRVLPVRIHDLDTDDVKLFEGVSGSVMRALDFVFKTTTGVNRPLKVKEDHPNDNLNKTYYQDQINKVSLAIKELISTLRQYGQKREEVPKEGFKPILVSRKNTKTNVIIGSVILLALIILGYFLIPTLTKPKEQLEKSIAVLPFINDSPSDSNKYFINAIMEDILTDLQTIKDLLPISRTSAEKYRTTTKSIPEIAKELGVNYIVEGSGQKAGNKIRLIVKLLRPSKEVPLWGNTYEQELNGVNDIFKIQSEIAKAIATQLEAVITFKERKLIEKIPTENLEAYKAYLKGRFYLRKFTANDLDTAMHYFNQAKEIDPEYALAYAGICDVWQYRQQAGIVSPAEGNVNAITAIMKALELDSNSAEVQYSLAGKKTWGLWDWKSGESGFKNSLSINPNNAMTHAAYSHLLNILGRPKEAMEQIEIALKLDPMNPFIITFYAIDLGIIRRYDESIQTYHDALKIEPGYSFAMWNLGVTLYRLGRYKEGLEFIKSSYNNDTEMLKALEHGYSEGGYKGALISQAKLDELRLETQYCNPTDIATFYALAVENDKAMYWMERAYELRDPNLPYLLWPIYDNLRNNPRFQELAKKMNLPYK